MSNVSEEIRQLKNRITTLEGRLRMFVSAVGDAKEAADTSLSRSNKNDERIAGLEDRFSDLEDGK